MSGQQRRILSLILLFGFFFLLLGAGISLAAPAHSSTMTSVSGSWHAVYSTTGVDPVPCLEYRNAGAEIRYGHVAEEISDCIPEAGYGWAQKSGLGFAGRNNVVLSCDGDAFQLGEFTHFNQPIYETYAGEPMLAGARLDIALGGLDITLPVDITFDETINDLAVCPYGGEDSSGGCYDRVTYATQPLVIAQESNLCEIQIAGFGPCNNSQNTTLSSEFITVEDQTNSTCLWAVVERQLGSVTEPEVACPAGYTELALVEGVLLSRNPRDDYDLTFDGDYELLVTGYAKEGHPEDGCSASGAGDSGRSCTQHQEYESFDVLLDGVKFGEYRDNLGANGLENWYFPVVWETTVSAGDQTLSFEHINHNSSGPQHSIDYKFAFCAQPLATTPTPEPSPTPSPTPAPEDEVDVAIDVIAPTAVTLGATLGWQIEVSNLSSDVDAENVQFTHTFPTQIGGYSLNAPAEWSCSTLPGTLTCTYQGGPGGSATLLAAETAPRIDLSVPVPLQASLGTADLIAGNAVDLRAAVSTTSLESNLANNTDEETVQIADQWNLIAPTSATPRLFTHVLFDGSLFEDGAVRLQDYWMSSPTAVPSHMQVPLQIALGVDIDTPPLLCLTNTTDATLCEALDGLNARTLVISAEVRQTAYTISDLVRANATSPLTFDSALSTSLPFSLSVDRLVTQDSCPSGERCVGFQLTSGGHAWTPSDLVYLNLMTPGGRALTSCPLASCLVATGAEPGFYRVEGSVDVAYIFTDPDSGSELYRLDQSYSTTSTLQLMVPVVSDS